MGVGEREEERRREGEMREGGEEREGEKGKLLLILFSFF
jgi:hypothetical protein